MPNVEHLRNKPAESLSPEDWKFLCDHDVETWHAKLFEIFPLPKPEKIEPTVIVRQAQAAPITPVPDPKIVEARRELRALFEQTRDRPATPEELEKMVELWCDGELGIDSRLYIHLRGHESRDPKTQARLDSVEKRLGALESGLEATKDALASRGIQYRGIYDATLVYRQGDVVTDHGSAWVSLVDVNKTRPSDAGAKWQLMVKRGGDR